MFRIRGAHLDGRFLGNRRRSLIPNFVYYSQRRCMTVYCDYCSSAQELRPGQVFCSHSHQRMDVLENGIAMVRRTQIDSEPHVTRLTIRVNLSGQQRYIVDGRPHFIDPHSYLIMNAGQTYQTAFAADCEQDMIFVAFQPDYAAEYLRSSTTPDIALLDNPLPGTVQTLQFFDRAYPMTTDIHGLFDRLRHHYYTPPAADLDYDALYMALLERLLQARRDTLRQTANIGAQRPGTRIELYRRLDLARAYIHANLSSALTLDVIAGQACLSKFHFARAFREAFGLSPYRYITRQRLVRAAHLLTSTGQHAARICMEVGFEDPASFGRLFRTHYGITPGAYRKQRRT